MPNVDKIPNVDKMPNVHKIPNVDKIPKVDNIPKVDKGKVQMSDIAKVGMTRSVLVQISCTLRIYVRSLFV